jgi:enamine deaminase RidA (YjgF/YER057c/UK114 family)
VDRINPDTIVKPASRYAQAMRHTLGGERLVLSGQIGVRPDGTVEQGLEAQMERAWSNVLALLAAAGFETRHMIKAVVYVTVPGSVGPFRTIRDRMLAGHVCAMTYLEISGLARPEYLVEIEAEAVKEP